MKLANSLNFSAVLLCCTSIALAIVILYYLRLKFGKAHVNCWFCNTDAVVLYRLKNSWTCSHCQQYNGFNENGDYNEVLPQMHEEKLNATYFADLTSRSNTNCAYIQQQVQLCEKCCRNQLLKVKQLSQFKPMNENLFELEVEAYKNKLDNLYDLCPRCKDTSLRHIKMQDTIIRGRMKSQKQREKVFLSSESISRQQKCSNLKLSRSSDELRLALWIAVAVFSFFYAWFYTLGFIGGSFGSNYISSIIKTPYRYDILGFIVVTGLVLTIAAMLDDSSCKNKVGLLVIVLWIVCIGFEFINRKPKTVVSNHVDQLLQLYSNCKDGNEDVTEEYCLYVLDDQTEFTVFKQFILSLLLILTSCISLYFTVIDISDSNPTFSDIKVQAKKKLLHSKKKETAKLPISELHPNLNDSIYSDHSAHSDEDILTDAKLSNVEAKEKGLNHDIDSLNALNLQDCIESNENLFKQPSSLFSQNNLPSTFHTPPPSRSSSLLSLTSHHSVTSHNPINKFGSTIDFARPKAEPLHRYKASSNSMIGGKYVVHSKRDLPLKSVASLPAMKLQKTSIFQNNRLAYLHNASEKKPLISPAKLQWRNTAKRQLHCGDGDCFINPLNSESNSSWDKKSEPDISYQDSASQVQKQVFSDASDDENFSCTPQRQKNLNSSSPMSAISNITNVTLESVKSVENSRMCRWVLVGCLLLNLVLVVLLVAEVKQMRAMEQWKSKVSL